MIYALTYTILGCLLGLAAIAIWTATGDPDHVWIVGSYFHFAGGFTPPVGKDISPNPGKSDPMCGFPPYTPSFKLV
jgi:hypothetical protein